MNKEVKELCSLDIELYKCISADIDTDKVVLTDNQLIHMADRHPEAYDDVLIELKETILDPDYIICDKKHKDTGLVIRKIPSESELNSHTFIVLRICTDSNNGELANSIISGWTINDKRLQNYLRNKPVLYKRQ